jgi:hypothetical protein
MSHIVEIQTAIRDPAAIQAACRRLRLPEPKFGETRLFSGAKTGWAVQLPGWQYPVICDVETGNIAFDDFGGAWGDPHRLNEFRQMYAAEKAKIEARKRGHTSIEQPLADGYLKVTVYLGGQP